QDTLQLPTRGAFPPSTPSGLTPNTRSEAEAALTHNIAAQTDSAAPTTPLHENTNPNEAQKAYRRPFVPIRTSSTNYEAALREAHHQASASSDLSTDTTVPADAVTDRAQVDSPLSWMTPFPPPGQGVVPLNTGVGSGQAEVVKKTRSRGLSLASLGRQQSWSDQDMKHLLQGHLMSEVEGKEAAGYGS
ncbi:hypothetical protein K458DRAFT_272917, partial [Lentithecium fluviatile CBS 122367]